MKIQRISQSNQSKQMENPIHDVINKKLSVVDSYNVIGGNSRVYLLEKLGNKQFFSK